MNDVSESQSEWSPDELIPFGKYILLDRIQSGATAAVYRANVRGEAGFERLVAIKRILPHMAGDRDFVDTFVREAKTVARLSHAGICPIYELGKVGESLYMAIEYVQGRDLGHIMRRLARRGEAMAPSTAAWIAARLCDALDFAHNLKNARGVRTGIIHRDISPTNVIVSYEGQVKLIDFGLAKAVGRAQSTNVDALKRKLGYMSPEMVKGKPLDARSDIFSVGVCLYEMITGRRLFVGANDIETLGLVGRASVPPPSAVSDDVPEELEEMLMRTLERDPENRFQTAADLGEALNRYIAQTDPSISLQRISDWMHELFAQDIEEEQARIKVLLKASSDLELIKRRRAFFASPSGAAARARAEIERRLSTEPPPVRAPTGVFVPRAASLPSEAASGVSFEDEATGYYDPDRTKAAPLGLTDADKTVSSPIADGTDFEDEPTQFKPGSAFAGLPAPVVVDTGGFDEEPTEIFFNKQEGIGAHALLEEINDVEPSGPLNRPIVDPDLEYEPAPPQPLPLPAVAPRPSPMPAPMTAWSADAARAAAMLAPVAIPALSARPPPESRRSWLSSVLIGASVLGLLLAIGALLLLSPIGVRLGLRPSPVGVIELRTSPDVAADVDLDSVFRGQSPLRMEGVSQGLRKLTVRAPGYEIATRDVAVEPGSTAMIEIALVPKPVPAPPQVDAEGAAQVPGAAAPGPATAAPVAVAPAQTAATPVPSTPAPSTSAPTQVQPATGGDGTPAPAPTSRRRRSRERATAPAVPAVEPSAAAPAPAAAPVAPAAVSPELPGSLAINTVPWSMVFIDGRDIGRTTPIFGFPIAPGPHEIRLQTSTGQVHVERVEVKPGQRVHITRRF
jgi:serine/threonine protein kinase